VDKKLVSFSNTRPERKIILQAIKRLPKLNFT